MNNKRRTFLLALGGSVVVPVTSLSGISLASAASGEKLDPQSPAAKNLNYSHESADSSRQCRGCQFYTPADDGGWGKCVIFPGKLVSANGLCTSWFARAS